VVDAADLELLATQRLDLGHVRLRKLLFEVTQLEQVFPVFVLRLLLFGVICVCVDVLVAARLVVDLIVLVEPVFALVLEFPAADQNPELLERLHGAEVAALADHVEEVGEFIDVLALEDDVEADAAVALLDEGLDAPHKQLEVGLLLEVDDVGAVELLDARGLGRQVAEFVEEHLDRVEVPVHEV